MDDLTGAVWRALDHKPQTVTHLADALGVTPREIQAAVNALRMDRYPVDSGTFGYFRPRSAEAYRASIRRRRERAIRQLVTNRREREAAEEMARQEKGQATMPIWRLAA